MCCMGKYIETKCALATASPYAAHLPHARASQPNIATASASATATATATASASSASLLTAKGGECHKAVLNVVGPTVYCC